MYHKSLSLVKQYLKYLLLLAISINLSADDKIFTKDEKNWISQHKTIRFVGDPNWLPYEAFDKDGNYIGIVADYLQEIEKITGLEFQNIKTTTWEESVNLIKQNKADMISETTDSQLTSLINFTNSYIENHIVIIMDRDSAYVDNLSQIQEKKLALIKGYGYLSKIKQAYPKINFIEVKNIHEGLEVVASGDVDALLCTMALGSYHIYKDGYATLRIVGKTEFSTTIGFGIQPALQPLVAILNKTIKILDDGKKQEILKKWILQEYIEKTDYTTLYIALGIFTFIFLIGISFYYHLKRETTKRLKAQHKILVQQTKMAAMGEMMDSIAHQWKQPLNALSMYSQLLESDFKDGKVNQAYVDEMVNDIHMQIEHMLNTLNEFRSFFRPTKKIQKINLQENIISVLVLIKDELLKNTIEVNLDIDNNIKITTIKNEFKHVILNILNNAKDAFNENHIKKRQIDIRAREANNTVTITICDNAGGIPQSIIKNIFKANITTKEEGKGTGIGLYMSAQIIKKSGGTIRAINKNNGACFIITIN